MEHETAAEHEVTAGHETAAEHGTATEHEVTAEHETAAEHGHPRIGGDIVMESLMALGVRAAVGLPGQHALGLFDALGRSDIAYLGARVENNAGFMADGLARTLGTVAPLLLSTGPGALTSLAALQEAASSSIPVLAISAQVPVAGLGGGRHGYLHELPDQAASFRGIVKSVFTVRSPTQIPSAIAEAHATALSAPAGPVLVEIPEDILRQPAGDMLPRVGDLRSPVRLPHPRNELVALAADWLSDARTPVILAGGGVVRADATDALRRVAETLGAPVVTTFGGKDAFDWGHPLSARSFLEDIATTEFLEDADTLLVVGSGLGELSSNYRTFSPRGRVIQIEADLGKLGSNVSGLGIHADARLALEALADALEMHDPRRAAQPVADDPGTAGHPLCARRLEVDAPHARRAEIDALLRTIEERLAGQALDTELSLLARLRDAVPDEVDTFWDMTILGYWAWSAWDPRGGRFVSAQGAGGLGMAFPAAIGSAFARRVRGDRSPVLAVSGDGGALYGVAELATLAQHGLDVTWLIVDDGGYGILREYMTDAFGQASATELRGPDFVALAESFGVDAVRTTLDDAPAAITRALGTPGPHVVVLPAVLRMFAPTHLGRNGG